MNLYIFEGNEKNRNTIGVICVMANNPKEAIELVVIGGRDSFDKFFTVEDNGSDRGWHIAKVYEIKGNHKKGRVYENWDNC